MHTRRPRYPGKNPRGFHEKYKELNPERYPADVEKVLASGKTLAGTHRPIMVASTPLRPLRDLFQREVNRLDELQAKSGVLALVREGGVFKFGGGFGFGAESRGHLSVNR